MPLLPTLERAESRTAPSSISLQTRLPELSNFYCHPGRAGGSPADARGYAYAQRFSGSIAREDFVVTVKTNELGLRTDPERKTPARARAVVLAVGDSFTFGWGVNYSQAWPARLELMLNAGQLLGSSPDVINAGVSGYSINQIRYLTQDLIEKLDLKVVILGYIRLQLTACAIPTSSLTAGS